jgi:DNA-binding CsgD family transcriptional regulator
MERFAATEVRPAFFAYVTMILAGSGLHLLFTLLPQTVSIVLTVLLPIVGAFALRPAPLGQLVVYAQTEAEAEAQPSLRQLAAATPLRFILTFGIISFALGMLQTLQLPNDPVLTPLEAWLFSLMTSAVAIAIAGVFAFLSYRFNTAIAIYIAIPLIACAALLLVVAPELPATLLNGPSNIGINLVNLLVWLLLIRTVRERRVPAVWCFALSSVAQFTGTILGQCAAILVDGNLTVVAFTLLVVLILAALVVVGAQREVARVLDTAEANNGDTNAALFGEMSLERLTRGLSEDAGLSPREHEVLLIWAAGHNSAHIEKTLFISKNTVKTHLSHIYAKTGAANREELLALLEQRR